MLKYITALLLLFLIGLLLPTTIKKHSGSKCSFYLSGIVRSKNTCLNENDIVVGYDSEANEIICSTPVILCN